MSIDDDLPQILRPFNPQEAWGLKQAARYSRRSEATLRAWASRHDIGRRIASGPWVISGPALLMLLDGDDEALKAYLGGDRTSDLIRSYFQRASEVARTGGTRHAA